MTMSRSLLVSSERRERKIEDLRVIERDIVVRHRDAERVKAFGLDAAATARTKVEVEEFITGTGRHANVNVHADRGVGVDNVFGQVLGDSVAVTVGNVTLFVTLEQARELVAQLLGDGVERMADE
jgi:hypothetical protein